MEQSSSVKRKASSWYFHPPGAGSALLWHKCQKLQRKWPTPVTAKSNRRQCEKAERQTPQRKEWSAEPKADNASYMGHTEPSGVHVYTGTKDNILQSIKESPRMSSKLQIILPMMTHKCTHSWDVTCAQQFGRFESRCWPALVGMWEPDPPGIPGEMWSWGPFLMRIVWHHLEL
jgi:hypothetical protein